MELISAYINWVAPPSSVRLQFSLIRVNSIVHPRFANSVDEAQVGDMATFSCLTSSTVNSAKVLRLFVATVPTPCSVMEILRLAFDGV
ncbi:hypothetical protein NC652_036677 [Populus alba x Populus x berolinensis]|nr:hypothetical protein NC652_036677 [Populus alba x Populus x berolinensis]